MDWLDWDSLLAGLLPAGAPHEKKGKRALGGGPLPALLERACSPAEKARFDCLAAIVSGAEADEEPLLEAGFSGGQARWLVLLSRLAKTPEAVLLELERVEPQSPAELYLREHLRLSLRANAFNLEFSVFASRRRLTLGLVRFGEHPALFFARARSAALLGFNGAAIDDLARAVYFSDQHPFYLRAVLEVPSIAELRPALVQQCTRALDPRQKVG